MKKKKEYLNDNEVKELKDEEFYYCQLKEITNPLKSLKDVNLERFKKELKQIHQSNNSKSLYIAWKVAEILKEDNQLFSTRGTISSSYIAYLLGITKINPLRYGDNKGDFYYDIPSEIAFGTNTNPSNCSVYFNVDKQYRDELIARCKEYIFNDVGPVCYYMDLDQSGDDGEINTSIFHILDKMSSINNYFDVIDSCNLDFPVVSVNNGWPKDIVNLGIIANDEITLLNGLYKKYGKYNRQKGFSALRNFAKDNDIDNLFLDFNPSECKRYTYSEFARMQGFAHSTYENGFLNKTFAFRDDIMFSLLRKGYDLKKSFEIMMEFLQTSFPKPL